MGGLRLLLCGVFGFGLIGAAGESVTSMANPSPARALSAITIVSGNVFVRHGNGEFVAAFDGEVVAAGDAIRTGDGARAVLTFVEGSSRMVEPSRELTIEASTEAGDPLMKSAARTVHVVTNLLTGTSKFDVRIPSTTASIRGANDGKVVDGGTAIVGAADDARVGPVTTPTTMTAPFAPTTPTAISAPATPAAGVPPTPATITTPPTITTPATTATPATITTPGTVTTIAAALPTPPVQVASTPPSSGADANTAKTPATSTSTATSAALSATPSTTSPSTPVRVATDAAQPASSVAAPIASRGAETTVSPPVASSGTPTATTSVMVATRSTTEERSSVPAQVTAGSPGATEKVTPNSSHAETSAARNPAERERSEPKQDSKTQRKGR